VYISKSVAIIRKVPQQNSKTGNKVDEDNSMLGTTRPRTPPTPSLRIRDSRLSKDSHPKGTPEASNGTITAV